MKNMLQLPFRLEIESALKSGDSATQGREFDRHRGDRLVADLLIRAGFTTGTWTFRIIEGVRCSSHTPAIQVRRPEVNGVILHVKPGDNGSGVKGVLIVTRDKGVTPDEVYQRLTNAMVVAEVTPNVAAGKPKAHDAEVPASGSPALPPPVTVETVLQHRDKLERIAALPGKLAEIKTQRAEIVAKIAAIEEDAAKKIETLTLADSRYELEEKKLLTGLDLEALALLVDSIK